MKDVSKRKITTDRPSTKRWKRKRQSHLLTIERRTESGLGSGSLERSAGFAVPSTGHPSLKCFLIPGKKDKRGSMGLHTTGRGKPGLSRWEQAMANGAALFAKDMYGQLISRFLVECCLQWHQSCLGDNG